MKHKKRTATILSALVYLIERQGLTPEEIRRLLIKTSAEMKHEQY